MQHVSVSPQTYPFPMPLAIVSAMVAGKPNHMPVAWFTRANYHPPQMVISLGRAHYTNIGIRENQAFGLSIPSVEMMAAVDHAGLVSGAKKDKSEWFEVFFKKLPNAPMLTDCPLTLACRLVQTVELSTNDLFIGEIVEAFCNSDYLSNGVPDIQKLQPFTLTMPDNRYWAVGEKLGKAWAVGKGYKPEPKGEPKLKKTRPKE